MKKILLALLIGTATLTVGTSCTKEYYDVVPSITMVYERTADQWEGTDNQAFLTLPVPELTEYYVKQGVVSVAYSDDGERTYKSIGTKAGAAYSFDYRVGSVTIRAEDPILGDFFVEVPDRIFIKVTLTEADFVE
ncbi:hypothetical protein BC792_11410 [Sphingobacterium allocomposti]|uniref:Uncharacterized protein n=1 Tax=Sphingobacterium allocomposti TaxID=415956 RepID=A0A5S5DEQ6_9SPHI|nr:hypothetical protein [Sphingobacterium composti Yoo et al. 2007 non Ten et al. 2007]TYP93109.1 hypothetical protein BC792_11410 [Sphingobacterium composti Yoo et al. 2007 non Ten et al. 2007]HLS96236.1 hypothetical protein [Sphingobacterium sp.]